MSTEEKVPKITEDVDEEEEEDEYLEDEYDTEDEEDEEDDEEEDDDELTELLANTLLTPEGDTLCGTLVRISNTLETQNKILIKLLSTMARK
jgi:hypothetical protein